MNILNTMTAKWATCFDIISPLQTRYIPKYAKQGWTETETQGLSHDINNSESRHQNILITVHMLAIMYQHEFECQMLL